MIAVVGGCYAEICLMPSWNHIYGSAGRAAAAISARTAAVELHTLLSNEFQTDFLFTMALYDVSHQFVSSKCSVTFEYLHPLASPYRLVEGAIPDAGTLPHVRGENILLFGMIEYSPTVHGNRVVYDPQSDRPRTFSSTGSTAKELIYVLNELELERLVEIHNLKDAANKLLAEENAQAIVVKRGPRGAAIFTRDSDTVFVPCYRARRVFKIGSGDIFAAAFAYFWQAENTSITDAADLASRTVACYAETQEVSIPSKEELLREYNDPVHGRPGSIYLAAPFFSLEQRWILEETKLLLENFGCRVFSPFHSVGIGRSSLELAGEDLEGLKNCDAILGLVNDNDTGTIFELGYGSATQKKTVLYAEKNSSRDLTMFEGTGCLIFPDYSSAIYNAVWESFAQ